MPSKNDFNRIRKIVSLMCCPIGSTQPEPDLTEVKVRQYITRFIKLEKIDLNNDEITTLAQEIFKNFKKVLDK